MTIHLGDLSQGQKAIDDALDITPSGLELTRELNNVCAKIHYENYKPNFKMNADCMAPHIIIEFSPMHNSDTSSEIALTNIKEMILKINTFAKTLIDQYCEDQKQLLINRKKEIIKQLVKLEGESENV